MNHIFIIIATVSSSFTNIFQGKKVYTMMSILLLIIICHFIAGEYLNSWVQGFKPQGPGHQPGWLPGLDGHHQESTDRGVLPRGWHGRSGDQTDQSPVSDHYPACWGGSAASCDQSQGADWSWDFDERSVGHWGRAGQVRAEVFCPKERWVQRLDIVYNKSCIQPHVMRCHEIIMRPCKHIYFSFQSVQDDGCLMCMNAIYKMW